MKKKDLDRTNANSITECKKISFNTGVVIEYYDCVSIIRIRADGCYSYVFIEDKKEIFVTRPIKKFENELPSCIFFKPHKSHLINLQHVRAYNRKECFLVMSDNCEIPLAKSRKNEYLNQMKIHILINK